MEEVYVVSKEGLEPYSSVNGFGSMSPLLLDRIATQRRWVDREEAEQDESLKQIIPYGVVHKSGEILVVERLSTQGEERLHGKLSLGIGGHVDDNDKVFNGMPAYDNGMHRELLEELEIDGTYSSVLVGYVNDNSTAVGRVHFGLVYLITVEEVSVRETDQMRGTFMNREAIEKNLDSFEIWSQHVYHGVKQWVN